LRPNGQLDPTFGAGGVGANGAVYAIAALPNGQYLIGGNFSRYNGQAVGRVARLNADGSLDRSFDLSSSGPNWFVYALAVDSQGRIVIGGAFDYFGTQAVPGLARVLPTGAFDATFVASVPGPEAFVYTVAVDATDKIIVAGDSWSAVTGSYVALVERLLPSGALDFTFAAPSTNPDDYVTRVRVLANGKVLVGGYLTGAPGTIDTRGIRRLNADGAVDGTFTSPFTGAFVRDLLALPNGQVLVAGGNLGGAGVPSRRILRLQPDGTPDPTFTAPPISSPVLALTLSSAGGVVVGGNFLTVDAQPQVGLARLTSAGSRDAAFSPPTFATYAAISGLIRQSNDRLVASGNFGTISGLAQPAVVRFTGSGFPDPTFQLDPSIPGNLNSFYASPIASSQNDRVLLAADAHLYRLQPSGARDFTFDDGTGATRTIGTTAEVYGVQEQPDGRVLAWGDFAQYNHEPRANLVRLTATGAVDPSFVPPPDSTVFVSVTNATALPNGMVLARTYYSKLYWLNADGTPLALFNGGAPLEGVESVIALPDNTALVRGTFTLNGTAYRGQYKLTAVGAVDPGFALPSGFSGAAVQVLPNGLLLGREYFSNTSRLRRLLPSGALDPSFVPVEFGASRSSESDVAYALQSTGDLVVGGGFTIVDGAHHPSLVRLTNIPTGLSADEATTGRGFDVFPNPAHATLTLRRATAEGATATLVDVLGRPVRHWPLTAAAQQSVSLIGVPAGAYAVRIQGATGILTRRVVVE
ncbi:MAG: T9SS type A sorting domain-containing protein, partial [Hymenobacteraceae bacterium]|nr:T9SS type A sorting domain-containing protein [Hymenobacteraceae bacterium]